MLTVDQALEAILRQIQPLPARATPLIDAIGLVLAEEIRADLDLPPFDKALMDGYAVRAIDLDGPGEYQLRVVDEILAGRMSNRALLAGEAARIMTGAPLPPGADAVVMVERTQLDGNLVTLSGPVPTGLNRMTRGREIHAGEVLLKPAVRLDATKIGLIASVGRSTVLAIPRANVGVVPTGDELVPIARQPQAGQIRNSNGVMLTAMARSLGAQANEARIAADDPARLREILGQELGLIEDKRSQSPPLDVLIISGGVSAGTRDLVPQVLLELGVTPIFHKVNVKPGKPLWFGVGPQRGELPGVLVFGLPGNPVSGVVGFLLFVKPALEALSGLSPKPTQLASFCLGVSYQHRGDRPTYHPCRVQDDQVIPTDWAGSADLRTVALADGFALFPAGDRIWKAGEFVEFLPLA